MDDPITLDQQVRRAVGDFQRRFGRRPIFAAAAPGRVNLIGEHTDYTGGFVLPIAIDRYTVVVADRAASSRAKIISLEADGASDFTVDDSLEPGQPSWANYVKGVVFGCVGQGLDPGGFDAVVSSTVPLGGGLSSSASLEVAVASLIEGMCGRQLDATAKALLCQKAEHDFAKVPCGIMDQFISVLGQKDHAMLLDCRSQAMRQVAMADASVAVLVINSNVKHELAAGEYAKRRAQCEAATEALGVVTLRDATTVQLGRSKAHMDALVYRRARHVLSENTRTQQAADAIAANDWPTAGRLMFESHASMRDDFEISCAEVDLLVELAAGLTDDGAVIGARMTGGGFGGCTVNLVRADQVEQVARHVGSAYHAETRIEPSIFATRPAAGARPLVI